MAGCILLEAGGDEGWVSHQLSSENSRAGFSNVSCQINPTVDAIEA